MPMPVPRPAGPRRGVVALGLVALALAATLLNAAKPLHIDDPFILRVAQHIAWTPLDPYGFDIFWYQWPQPVHEELTPPVLPYWWALGLRVLGDSPLAWKLWLFPFVLLLVVGVHALLRRFARGTEVPLTVMTVCSPAFLPSLNLMQDVPAQGLGLSALALYLRAAECDRLAGALAAGLVAGLATQTKYTAVTVVGAVLVHGALFRRLRLALATAGLAVAVFVGWEALMTLRYGQGMFLGQLRLDLFWEPRWAMVPALLRLVGATAPLLSALGLAGLGLPPGAALGAGVVVVAVFVLLLAWPLEGVVFAPLGVLTLGVVAACGATLARVTPPFPAWSGRFRRHRVEWFLLLWLAGEVVGYFATAQFPAVRRVLGLIVVSTLIVARLVALRARSRRRALPLWPVAALCAMLGLGFWGVDLREAQAQRQAVAEAARFIRQRDPAGRVWFLGHWGFQYYAERAGWRPVVPDYSRLGRGDWLVVPDRIHKPGTVLTADEAEIVGTVAIENFPPLLTGWGFYAGSTPLQHHRGPRLTATVARMRREVVPPSSWTARELVDWALRAGGQSAAWAVPALVRELARADAATRELIVATLWFLGPRAVAAAGSLREALRDETPRVRWAAARALGALGRADGPTLAALAGARQDSDPAVREAAAAALARLQPR